MQAYRKWNDERRVAMPSAFRAVQARPGQCCIDANERRIAAGTPARGGWVGAESRRDRHHPGMWVDLDLALPQRLSVESARAGASAPAHARTRPGTTPIAQADKVCDLPSRKSPALSIVRSVSPSQVPEVINGKGGTRTLEPAL